MQTSMMKFFRKNSERNLAVFFFPEKHSIIDVQEGFKYTSELNPKFYT